MALRFIGIDPDTGKQGSPTVWVDEQTRDIVVQGWTATDDDVAACLTAGHGPGHSNDIPAGESVVRVPARMAAALRKACDAAGA